MKLLNKSKGLTLSGNAKTASSFLSRARGLLFTPPTDLVLISPRVDIPSSTIHMFLMAYPLDVIWADAGMTVIDVQRGVLPANPFKPGTWKTYKPKKPAKYVIELGLGSAGGTEPGDILSFI